MTTTTIPTWTLGDRLRKAREASGVSVQAMADYFGVSRKSINNWESDRSHPSRATRMQWALRTGVALDWIEGGDHHDGGPDGGRGQGVRSYGWKTREHLLTLAAA